MAGRKFIDKTGMKYGRLTVLSLKNKTPAKWLCKCDCGNETIIYGSHLIENGTKSCGCLNKELTSKRVKTHGLTKSKTYQTWRSMKGRCLNPNYNGYKRYGGAGIKVCDSWMDFNNFLLDMGERPKNSTLDRIDNSGDYEPKNCRWATPKQQASNRNKTLNITYNGITKSAKEWSNDLGLANGTVWNRIMILGWEIEKAVTFGKAG